MSRDSKSRKMSSVRQKGTIPEKRVRSLLEAEAIPFSTNVRKLPGSPDLLIEQANLAIFVHGCFWHRHGCRYSSFPRTNTVFWTEKFEKNVNRDKDNVQRLNDMGYSTFTIWQCETEDAETLAALIHKLTTMLPHEFAKDLNISPPSF